MIDDRALNRAIWIKKRKELRLIFQTVKPEEDDARRKEITLLLAADNVDDESQMDMAVHGELAGKIVEHIFEQASRESRCATISQSCFFVSHSLFLRPENKELLPFLFLFLSENTQLFDNYILVL